MKKSTQNSRSLCLPRLLLVVVCSGLVFGADAATSSSQSRWSSSSASISNKKDGSRRLSTAFLVPHGGATAKKKAPKTTAPSPTTSSGSSTILSFPKDHPFAFQLMVATIKTAAADLMVQIVTDGKAFPGEIDWKRNAIFVVFGFGYLGGFQWYLMVNKYRDWFPTMDRFAKLSFAEKLQDRAGIVDAIRMVLFDVIVHLPLMYFPTYYAVKEFVGGDSWNPIAWVKDGIGKYLDNFQEDLLAMIKLWGPSDCVQFILPLHLRMPFRHLVSFFWTAYVSFTRGAIQAGDVADAAAAATEAVVGD